MARTGRLVGALTRTARGVRALTRRRAGTDPRPARWQVVTVTGRPEQVLPAGRWPEPLRRLDGAVEVWARPAPGGRGTELAVRPLGGASTLPGFAAHLVGDDPGRFLRQVLRETRQLLETGEVLRADRAPLDRPGTAG
ncbi:hypothetical protein [Micromonospora robiginosa]|uniref:Polyketide cyclase/dehydrase/lipid transport protein n=1 Tax=Micromonospora robiginosa TaxID=2749844 RepID=A0A7L6B5P3_9ACTN|nr:hypothetical protein [Micromonospora ferruginea]QLQ37258.1 hypothetical protein H1D33_29260 [Micromonospora ferruginea]